jgi:hypothetical protein
MRATLYQLSYAGTLQKVDAHEEEQYKLFVTPFFAVAGWSVPRELIQLFSTPVATPVTLTCTLHGRVAAAPLFFI